MSRRKVEDELTDVPHDCVSETTVVAQEVEVSTGGESAVEKRRQNLLLGDAYRSSSSGRARKRSHRDGSGLRVPSVESGAHHGALRGAQTKPSLHF